MMNESKKIVKNVELDTKNQKQEIQLRIKDTQIYKLKEQIIFRDELIDEARRYLKSAGINRELVDDRIIEVDDLIYDTNLGQGARPGDNNGGQSNLRNYNVNNQGNSTNLNNSPRRNYGSNNQNSNPNISSQKRLVNNQIQAYADKVETKNQRDLYQNGITSQYKGATPQPPIFTQKKGSGQLGIPRAAQNQNLPTALVKQNQYNNLLTGNNNSQSNKLLNYNRANN